MNDQLWMKSAIEEGVKGRLDAPPNPWVGCVIVKDKQVIGKGYHPECGLPHAEIFALKQAGEQARGATAYVTLEPCSHTGRTPPCVQALIQSGISRVVVGVVDPDPKVAGSGVKALKSAGIQVDVGIESQTVEMSLESYLHHRRTGRPYVIGKAAISIDGKVSAADGSSQWISSKEARADAHQIRAESQAILIGSGTALSDSPRLTVRNSEKMPKRHPLRVVLDRSGRVPDTSSLFDVSLAPTLLFSNRSSAPKEVELLPFHHLEDILNILGSRGVLQVLVEGGSSVLSHFLDSGLIDRLVIYMGPKMLGQKGMDLFQSKDIETLSQAKDFNFIDVQEFAGTLKMQYQVQN